jgi:hypothetical protein
MPSIVNTFAEISDQYDVAFVDLWLHAQRYHAVSGIG